MYTFCQKCSQWCLIHCKISLHLEEAKRLPRREHCVGNVGKSRSAWKDGKWVTVLMGATMGLGRVVLRWVMEGRARETVRHWIVFHCVIKSLKKYSNICSIYDSNSVHLAACNNHTSAHVLVIMKYQDIFGHPKIHFPGTSVSQWTGLLPVLCLSSKKRLSTEGLRK